MATTAKTASAKPAAKKRNIFEALIAAEAAVKNVQKNGKNKFDGYAYRGIDDVMDAVHGAFVQAGVIAIPTVLNKEQVERTSKKGELMIHTTLEVKYTFYAEDGTNISTVVQGEGMDRGDKSINKAMSGAYKYAMFQVLAIPTAEMIDSETDSPEIQPSETISGDSARKLAAIIKVINDVDQAWWPEICEHYGIARTTEIKTSDYNAIVQAAQARADALGRTS